jgi:glucosylceramidase
MNATRACLAAFIGVFVASLLGAAARAADVDLWLTTMDRTALFVQQKEGLSFGQVPSGGKAIEVDSSKTLQTIDGFGYCLTGGSAMHMIHMEKAARAALIKELFATDGTNIGVSYLRVSIGASDLNERVFSYDDLPAGQTDMDMAKFTLDVDRADVIPVLKEILAVNPKIMILGSPWSAPTWMKSNGKVKGGQLKPECYPAYAKYFVKYIQGMKAEGIRIDAITVQNEPLHDGNTPSLKMVAEEQADFIKNHLGPAFKAAAIDTKIVLYDHNCDLPEYPISILKDPAIAQMVDGSGFHLYKGRIEAMSTVHDAFPAKNLYFTEQMVTGSGDRLTRSIGPQVQRLVIGATRNWSRNVLLWNLAADPKNQPHTNDGGCASCQGAITIDGNTVSRNAAYYVIAHASKFARPGSVRVATNLPAGLPNVAFKTPEGKIVLVVVNSGQSSETFAIRDGQKTIPATLAAGAVATYIW